MVLHLFQVPAAADAEQEPAAGDEVDAGHLLGQSDGVALDHQTYPRPDAQAFRGGGCWAQGDEGVQGLGVVPRQLSPAGPRGAPAGGDVGVLREEERFEAALLHGPGQFRGSDGVVGGGHGDAELHMPPPETAHAIGSMAALA